MTGPSGKSVPVAEDGQLYRTIRIIPREIGTHRIVMQINGQNINGTPLTLNAIDSRLPIAHGSGLHHAVEDRPAAFYLDSQNMCGKLEVQIEGPQQFTKNQIERQSDGSHLIKYTPVEVGLFKIFVKWNSRDIPGSPFISYVVNPEKVKIVGGWQSILNSENKINLKLNEEKSINFDVTDAGPGTLSATVFGPNGSKVPLDLINKGNIYSLVFTPIYEGDYKINILWDNDPLPNMPLRGVTMAKLDLNRVELSGEGLREAKINLESCFIIDGSKASDSQINEPPDIKLTGTRADCEIKVAKLGNNCYKCTYTPEIPGAYLLNIKWKDRQIGDSPYKVNVGMNSNPSKVFMDGECIKSCVFGEEIKAIIDTRRAGPGELTAYCMGPTKVAFCEFYDHKDGTFTVYIRPQETGKHCLQIKYNGEHIPDSPFVIRIAGAPDASKVKVLGPGITHGVIDNFISKFICETKGAGAGQLTVRIRGPKGLKLNLLNIKNYFYIYFIY